MPIRNRDDAAGLVIWSVISPAGVAFQNARFSSLGGLVVTGVKITVAVWVSWSRVFCWQVNLALIIGFIPWWSVGKLREGGSS